MLPADETVRRLRDVHARLGQAVKNRAWPALAATDQEISDLLAELKEMDCDDSVERERSSLKHTHALATQLCARECERLRTLLQRHLAFAEGSSAYQNIEGIGGEGA
jgi:hypothetical protein